MLTITIPSGEVFNSNTNEIFVVSGRTLHLEHSLISVSKWEQIYCKPFLNKDHKTEEELRTYIKCMTIETNVDPYLYLNLTSDNVRDIVAYMESPSTATTIKRQKKGGHKEKMTSEVIYYSMIANNIPFECEKWHLNRLLTLIEVCSIKNTPQKKMGRNEILRQNAQLNAERLKHLNTKG